MKPIELSDIITPESLNSFLALNAIEKYNKDEINGGQLIAILEIAKGKQYDPFEREDILAKKGRYTPDDIKEAYEEGYYHGNNGIAKDANGYLIDITK